MFNFNILKRDEKTAARLALIHTAHGEVRTPVFMPVGTQGTVKALTHDVLLELGVEIILGNTYHLYLRPGHELIQQLGGLHKFIGWEKPILTDSGGFQVFSMSDLNRVNENGVQFKSHIDGSTHFFTPERSIEIQVALGVDILMAFDECTIYPATRQQTIESAELTSKWAERCKTAFPDNYPGALFGIIQGGMFTDIRERSATDIINLDFDGYAIGGLSVGEPKELMFEIVDFISPFMPQDRPRYLMGSGMPSDIIRAVSYGIDMFDCVLPTRNARNGYIFTNNGKIIIKHTRYKADHEPLDIECKCYTCMNFSRAYLRHLFMAGEITAAVLMTIHNLYFYLDLINEIRQALSSGNFHNWMIEKLRKFDEVYKD